MSLVVTPVGEYENAFFCLNGSFTAPNRVGRDYGYYGVLVREQPKEMIDRVATFSVIADKFVITSADWGFGEANATPEDIESQFGLAKADEPNEWDPDAEALAAMVLTSGAIPQKHIHRITRTLRNEEPYRLKSGLDVKQNEFQYICRLFAQLRTSINFSTKLLISEEDKELIALINDLIEAERWPLPFEMPDVRESIQPEQLSYDLLLFRPPDYEALLAVRKNPQIAKYASKVRSLIESHNDQQESNLLSAMKEALSKKEVADHVDGVFETESWGWRAMHFMPVLDKIAIFGEIISDLCGRWARRKRESCEWYAIGPKMQTIAIEDYLKRKGNIYPVKLR
jgi:hypothetical protein